MEHLVKIKKDSINECFKRGLIKPNEFKSIVDEQIHKELYMRFEYFRQKNLSVTFLYELFSSKCIEKYYEERSTLKEGSVSDHIINLCKTCPDSLLLDPLDSRELFVANAAYQKSLVVRNCGDMLENPHSEGQDLLVDKETLRSVEYLLKYKNSIYELLNNNFGE